MHSGGTDLTREPLTVGVLSTVPAIEVILRNDGGDIDCTVNMRNKNNADQASRDLGGAEAGGPVVFAIPIGPHFSALPRMQVREDGSARFSNLSPGLYRVVALERLRDLDSADPSVVAKVMDQGETVRVAPGMIASVTAGFVTLDGVEVVHLIRFRGLFGFVVSFVVLACIRAQEQLPIVGGDISGTVASETTGQVIEDAHVSLFKMGSSEPMVKAVADAKGRFDFSGVPEGKYQLSASRKGYSVGSIVVEVGGGATTLSIRLEPQGSIEGAVKEDSGDPVPRAQISLYRVDFSRKGNGVSRMRTQSTDAMGNFKLTNLKPGQYLLGAVGVPWYALKRRSDGSTQPQTDGSGLSIFNVRICPDLLS